MRKIVIISICILLVLFLGACSREATNNIMEPATGNEDCLKEEPAGGETAGNNLSFPVIWSDGYSLALRGTYGEEMFLGASSEVDGVTLYHQQDLQNEWQAESASWGEGNLIVDWIDWGDNLESKSWPDRSKIRVETVLFQDLVQPMVGYEMGFVSGLGIDEMWGATAMTYEAPQATVYSHNARLTIQLLPENPDFGLDWDRDEFQWKRTDDGPMNPPVWSSAVYETSEGSDSGYSAEINIKGKVIYGMLWDTRQVGDGPGLYRLTFSFDDFGPVPLNTRIGENTQIVVAAEEGEKVDSTGGNAVVDHLRNMTYIDVEITERGGGGGGDRDDRSGGGGNGNGGGQ